MPKVLIIDDEESIRETLKEILDYEGYEVEQAEDGLKALKLIKKNSYDVALCDIKMPEIDGLELLEKANDLAPDLPFIMISGHGNIDTAIEATKKGAFDFISKPPDLNKLLIGVRNATEKNNLVAETKVLKRKISKTREIIGESKSIQNIKKTIDKVAPTDARVLITGENGTGKELVARWIHEGSKRNTGPFIEVNCAAIPAELIESELFGHEAGAFTGAGKKRIGKLEYADKGTLFFDEIESMPLSMQVKVLRSLQEHTVERVGGNQQISVDLRVIAAAKEDLNDHDEFRQDLYYRLNVAQIYLPPLREREEDALILFEHFALKSNPGSRPLSEADRKAILAYAWPGNVRELRNVAMRFALDETVSVMEILSSRPSSTTEETQAGVPLAIQLHNFERKVLHDSLVRHQGRITDVMVELDLPRRTLNQKMQKFGLNRSDYT